MVIPQLTRVQWSKTCRLIRSIYPPINLFEDVADPKDWELIAAAEAKTNPRVRDDIGSISLVPAARRVSGSGASWVMAPFCHISMGRPSRFSDGAYGVYYAGSCFDVALLETIYHFERFMRATNEAAADADYRELIGTVDTNLHDLRGNKHFEKALDPNDYAPSQVLARRLRDTEDSNGIIYPSVRYPKGEAIAVFWPDVVGIPIQGRHLRYHWDGMHAGRYFIYGEDQWLQV